MHVARQHRMYAGRQTRAQGSGMTRLSTRATMTKGAWIGGVFFCCGPARTLTHSLRAWVAMPRPGGATAVK